MNRLFLSLVDIIIVLKKQHWSIYHNYSLKKDKISLVKCLKKKTLSLSGLLWTSYNNNLIWLGTSETVNRYSIRISISRHPSCFRVYCHNSGRIHFIFAVQITTITIIAQWLSLWSLLAVAVQIHVLLIPTIAPFIYHRGKDRKHLNREKIIGTVPII